MLCCIQESRMYLFVLNIKDVSSVYVFTNLLIKMQVMPVLEENMMSILHYVA